MFGGIGSTELIVILLVALVLLGPSKLPEIARSLGKALREFRQMSSDVKRTIEMEAEQTDLKKTKDESVKTDVDAPLSEKESEAKVPESKSEKQG